MSHEMRPQSLTKLLTWILREYRENGSIFGIHKSFFWEPSLDAPYASELFGDRLATPIGPAAGPNTQLAQNIVSAWLCGARFMELKTVQIMDELTIARPCIDMEDEGYNVEWSQELKLEKSAHEYIKAWVLIPVLRRLLGWEACPDGLIFNLSVGYNLEGILAPRMQSFIDTMLDASGEISFYRNELRTHFPDFTDVVVPNSLTNSCTLSTMHGCPPDEIGRIAAYLLEDRGFHLTVKLNPTLMGASFVRKTLNDTLGYESAAIPDAVFEHDLKYGQALEIINTMRERASACERFFGVKLSNTLAMSNGRGVMPGEEMYMSGRSLYPITMNLWNNLQSDTGGKLNVSYSAGADALNVARILSCGAFAATMASDILKPGGYARFAQCLENLGSHMKRGGASNLAEFAAAKAENLRLAAAEALLDPRYKKQYFPGAPKVSSPLEMFDCIEAPCTAQCAVCQDVPAYALQISRGDYDGALATIMKKNPLPGLTGHVCTHLCETRCTRANYDEAVGIRSLKRFAASRGRVDIKKADKCGRRIAVIGAGPSGLSAAYTLARAGCDVVIYEARERAGGMMALAPVFRVPAEVLDEDVARVTALGVELRTGTKVENPRELLGEGYDAVYVACGMPADAPLGVPGEDAAGVWGALVLLERVSCGEKPSLGKKVLIVGGGNTAMDAARTAQRLIGAPVTVVYRRTKKEMPATEEEKRLLFEEGNRLEELSSPVRAVTDGKGAVKGLECERTRLGEPDASGRRRPEPTGEFFVLEADSIISAIGQTADEMFFKDSGIALARGGLIEAAANGRTSRMGVYAGGDAVRGPAIVISACADGIAAANSILGELGVSPLPEDGLPEAGANELDSVRARRARKSARNCEPVLPVENRKGFGLVEQTLNEDQARAEAERCLQCSSFCGKCVEVCPNRANYNYTIAPLLAPCFELEMSGGDLAIVSSTKLAIAQSTQIVHIDDFCNECGNCATFCVHEGRPYMDKPRLFLNDEDFAACGDNAFLIEGDRIFRRAGGRTESLAISDRGYLFENGDVCLTLDRGYTLTDVRVKRAPSGRVSTRSAIEMSVIHAGVRNSLSWLLDWRKHGGLLAARSVS